MWLFKHKLQEAETGGEGGSGGGQPAPAVKPVSPTPEQAAAKAAADTAAAKEAADAAAIEAAKRKAPEAKPLTGGSVGEQIGVLFDGAGIDRKEAMAAVTANEGKITPELMAALVEKHGEAVATLTANQIEGIHTANTEKAKAADKVIYDMVAEGFKDSTDQSGEESWKELSEWAKTNIDESARNELNVLLGMGGIAAKLATQELINEFKATSAPEQEAQLEEGTNVSDSNGAGGISKSEYNIELSKLLGAGHDYETSQEVAKLQRRRQKGRSQGL